MSCDALAVVQLQHHAVGITKNSGHQPMQPTFDLHDETRIMLLIDIAATAAHYPHRRAHDGCQRSANKIGFGQKEMYNSGTATDQYAKQLCGGNGGKQKSRCEASPAAESCVCDDCRHALRLQGFRER